MTIRRSIDVEEIKVGDYILGGGFFQYDFCSRPCRVTKISGARIYYDLVRLDNFSIGRDSFMNRDKITFVCDTEEEVRSLLQLSSERHHDTTTAVDNARRQIDRRCEDRLNQLIRESK